MSVQAQSLQGLEDCNPSSTNHPTSCCLCRQQKLERPDSGHHGAKCEFCHAEHKRPKHPVIGLRGMACVPQRLERFEDCNPGSSNHPHSCRQCRQYKPERPDSCHHGARCEFCHHAEHKRPKHRSQRGRHNLQRKEYQELREHMPAKLAEIIDLIYFVTNGEQQKVKKFMQYLKTVLEKFQEAVEVKVLAAVNNIGQQAQCLRPDNARVRRTCEPGVGEKQVDLASRYKWLSGTLHLLVRKLFESKEQSEELMDLHTMHVESFKQLRLSDPSKPSAYAEAILEIRQRHKRLPRLFAEAVKRIASINESVDQTEAEPSTNLELWAETFLRSRVSTELLMSHFEACAKQSSTAARWRGVKPVLCAVRTAGTEPHPIRVSLCADDSQVVIRISDRAGGMHSKCASQVWSYLFTTSPVLATLAHRVEEAPWGVDGHGESPMAGRGIGLRAPEGGLPLCRLYAMYLGASLHLMMLGPPWKEDLKLRSLIAAKCPHSADLMVFCAEEHAWPRRGCILVLEPDRSSRCLTCFHFGPADAEVEDRDLEDRTPLMWAARHGHLSVVKLLLRRCPDLTHRDKEGLAALDHCREHLEMRAAVVLAQEQCQRLADGAQRNDLPLVEHLLQHGALPRYKDAGGWTPLTWAVLHNSADMAHVLVRYGAYPELIGENSELGQQLSRRGRQVGARLASVLGANTRLLDAAQASNFTDAQEALEQGACPNAKQGHDGGGGGLAPRSKGRISKVNWSCLYLVIATI
eukprot:g22928.t1